MPEPKGRKSKRDRERERRRTRSASPPSDGAPEVTRSAPAPTVAPKPQPQAQQPLPSAGTRASGVMLAFVTVIAAAWLLYDAVSGDRSGVELVARLFAGAFLLVLAVVVGVLSTAPEVARRILRRFMAGRYRVEDGDTLESIAGRTGLTVRDLQAINPELTGELVPGSTVYLPRQRRRR